MSVKRQNNNDSNRREDSKNGPMLPKETVDKYLDGDYSESVLGVLFDYADQAIKEEVSGWCRAQSLKGEEDEILNKVHYEIVKYAATRVFKRDPDSDVIDYSKGHFVAWCYDVVYNIANNYYKSRKKKYNTSQIDGLENILADRSAENKFKQVIGDNERHNRLITVVDTIVDSNSAVYKNLTWLAFMKYFIRCSQTKIKTTKYIIDRFTDKTLWEMYITVTDNSDKLPWLNLSEQQRSRLEGKLEKKVPDGRRYADTLYGEYYMTKGPEATLSDWMNRLRDLFGDRGDNK